MRNRLFRRILLGMLFFPAVFLAAGGAKDGGTSTKSVVVQKDPNVTVPGTLPIVKEKITLTLGLGTNNTVKDWKTNDQTVYIEKMTGINLEFIEFPGAEITTKVELMIAAGGKDLPDILLIGTNNSTLVKWAQSGSVLNLTNYWNELSYFIKKNIDECCLISYEDYVRGMKAYDGNIYGAPGYSGSYHNQFTPNFILVYQPWLDKLGIDRYSIVTTEDYYNLLVKIRDTDLNENGIRDEIPLISSIDFIQNVKRGLMSPFITCQPNYWINENGKIDVVFNRDGWREGIRYIRRLVKEGLLLPESFTQDVRQMTAIQLQNPNVVGGVARISTTNIPSADPRYFSYFQIMPLQGPSGMREIIRVPLGPTQSGFISAHTRYPEAAFRLVDYMAGEEISNWTRNGPKNVGWVDPKPGELSPYEAQGFFTQFKTTLALTATTNWANVGNSYWANSGPRIYGEKYALGQALASTVSETEKNFYYTQVKDYVRYGNFANDAKMVSGLVYNEEEQEIINSIYTPVLTYVDECWTRFVLGDLNIDSDADWNTYLRELSRMDISKSIAATQACYNRVYGK